MPDPTWTNPRQSPLWMVTREPLIHQFVGYLQDARRQLLERPGQRHELVLSRSRAAEVTHAFGRTVRQGEERLHRLARLLADHLYAGRHELRSVVVGEIPGSGERFLLQQPLSVSQLYGLTDMDLGQRLLARVRLDGPSGLVRPRLVANAVEYLPVDENPWHAHKIISRIKAEEEVWEKVVDEIFDVDSLIQRDKELRAMSRFVKDVFGLKIVVGSAADAPRVHAELASLRWDADFLAEHRVAAGEDTATLRMIETKDYLSREGRKRSGFMAIKSVVGWWDATFEVQVQPLRNYYRERERITRESHDAHKLRREALRERLAHQVPLMAFMRDLLRWLFGGQHGAPPEHPDVALALVD